MTNTTIRRCRHSGLSLLAAMAVMCAFPGGALHAATINGCVNPGSGILRVIDPSKGQSCRAPETPISWNETGPQGTQGVPGTNGTNGTNGVSGYEIVEKSFIESSSFGNTIGFAINIECPAGKKVLSAGGDANWFVGNTIISFAIVSSTLLFTSSGIGEASLTVTKPTGAPFAANEGVSGRAQAVCAIAL